MAAPVVAETVENFHQHFVGLIPVSRSSTSNPTIKKLRRIISVMKVYEHNGI
jgi:hypothetical protein